MSTDKYKLKSFDDDKCPRCGSKISFNRLFIGCKACGLNFRPDDDW